MENPLGKFLKCPMPYIPIMLPATNAMKKRKAEIYVSLSFNKTFLKIYKNIA
jgi:hypothetical protein